MLIFQFFKQFFINFFFRKQHAFWISFYVFKYIFCFFQCFWLIFHLHVLMKMSQYLAHEQYKIHHYQLANFLLFCSLFVPHLLLKHQKGQFYLKNFRVKNKIFLTQVPKHCPQPLAIPYFLFHCADALIFFVFFCNLFRGWIGTCLTKITSSSLFFVARTNLSQGWTGTCLTKITSSSLFFVPCANLSRRWTGTCLTKITSSSLFFVAHANLSRG